MMVSMSIFFGRRAGSAGHRGGGGGGGSAGDRRRQRSGLRRLVRELRRQSKTLMCLETKSTALRCQYDPLSYSRNFDGNGFGAALDDDEDVSSDHFYYTFSSRFAAPPAGSSSCSYRVLPCSTSGDVATSTIDDDHQQLAVAS